MIGEERDHIGFAAQHIIHEALERFLRATLDKDPAAFGVECLKPFDPLDGRGDLSLQNVLDALNRGGVEFAGDVRHQRQLRRVDVQAVKHGT